MEDVDNESLVRRIFEGGSNRGNLTAAGELFTVDFVHHSPSPPTTNAPPGPETFKQNVSRIRAFPDVRFEIEDTISDADKVVVRWTARGTHLGPFRNITPTGRPFQFSGITIARVTGGKVREWWFMSDQLRLVEQLRSGGTSGTQAPR